ncbi:proteinase-activated receptor 1-like [Scleropages formosus]|uniref:Proteinase-activated receptor 1 n=1 Tax=Scleropages formosus TaxID=113540 RepID=A0A8D0CHJ8_SCLFO|nr:proteinase-activated receptor 1-like [Scleropages formosus]
MCGALLFLAFVSLASGYSLNRSVARSFPVFTRFVTDEPIDFTEGSGYIDSNKSFVHHGTVKHYITDEAKQFLTGPLLTTFIPSIYTVVFIISVPLNILAIIMFVMKVRPTKPAGIYMINLALADLLFLLLLPFKMSYHFNGNNWIYGPVLCRIVTATFYCNMYCSILLMMCISLDRFLAVVHPIKSLTWRSPLNARVACCVMWLLASVGVLPIFVSEQAVNLPDLGIITCHDVLDMGELQGYYLYFFPIFSSVFFFIPLIIVVFCYVRIIQALSTTSIANSSKKTRAIFMAIAVLTVFVACFTPTNIILLIHYIQFAHKHSDTSYVAYLLSMCIGSISCCLDPLIYYFGSSQCQKQVAAILHCRSTTKIRQGSQSKSTCSSKLDPLSSQYTKLMV